MHKLIILLITVSLITSCSILPIKEAGRFISPINTENTISSLEKLVLECWTKPLEGFMGSDAIYGKQLRLENGLIVILGRDNHDIPFIPFAHITVKGNKFGNPEIVIQQGGVAYGVFYDVNKGVHDWFHNNQSCRSLGSYSITPKKN